MLAFLCFQHGHGDILGPILSLTVSYSLSFLFNCFSRDPCGTKILFEEFLAKPTGSLRENPVSFTTKWKQKLLKRGHKKRACSFLWANVNPIDFVHVTGSVMSMCAQHLYTAYLINFCLYCFECHWSVAVQILVAKFNRRLACACGLNVWTYAC